MGNVVQLSALWETYLPEKRTWWVFQEMSPQVCWGMHCLPGSVSPITISGDRSNDQLVVWKALYTLSRTTIHTDIGYYRAQSIHCMDSLKGSMAKELKVIMPR